MGMGLAASANVVRDLKESAKSARVALANEYVTRQRVDRLEAWAQAFQALSLWQRLRWLIRGW
jgi:hypothetical protein